MTLDSLVGGRPLVGTAGTLRSTSPARTDDVVAEVSLASADQVVEAFRTARAAQPGWAATPAPVRGRVVAAIGRLVEANAEALANLGQLGVGELVDGVADDHGWMVALRRLPRGGACRDPAIRVRVLRAARALAARRDRQDPLSSPR